MQLTILNWLLAVLPVAVVLILMITFKWGGSKAGAMGWFASIAVAVIFFGVNMELIAFAQIKSLLLSLDVMYIIWMALLLFHVTNEAGAVKVIGHSLPRLTSDRVMQGLLLGWVFASFLQGMGGFGVPIAIVAPLLVGLGFSSVQSVIMAAVGHGWAVNFGSLATSFQSLLAVTGLPGEILAPAAAVVLGIASFGCGILVAYVGSGWKGLWHSVPAVFILGTAMSTVQFLLVTNGMWTLGATGAGLVGLIVSIIITRLPFYRGNTLELNHKTINEPGQPSLLISLSPYFFLIVLTFIMKLIPTVENFLGQVQLVLEFPELATSLGWVTQAEAGRRINVFGHPGAALFYTSLIAYFVFARAGYLKPSASARIIKKVGQSAVKSSLGILAMVGMALMMSHSGMTYILAQGLSQSFGKGLYPLVAPFIGALGAFITGSNNNANVLFGVLQMNTAQLLGLSTTLILAAQTAGGSLGSIMAPAKIIVGCSTVNLNDSEGEVIELMLVYGVILLLLVAAVTTILNLIGSTL
jgi:lactate permease